MKRQATHHPALRLLTALALFTSLATLHGAEPVPPEMRGVDIVEHLGEKIPLDVRLTNEQGESVELGQYITGDKPVMLMLVYYSCPTLCNTMLNELTHGLKAMQWTAGENFEILTVSIDPTETAELAAAKKANYLREYGRPEAARGWHWFVGDKANIDRLAEAVGFKYKYDPVQRIYAHPPATYVISPAGVISRYLYGISYDPKTMKLALLEAGEGKIGSTLDRLILFCYHYDPSTRGYTLMALRIMRLGGGLTAVALFGMIGTYLWLERRRRRRMDEASAAGPLEEPAAAAGK
ncbi:MAG: AhpC/TSA family protein [candidate division BRC1 bacterium ADurb.BinA292]|nr:MAG: AhpC/TSA family protein [candidate division BRC1 bacterium ADurb.BinA292]